jgi:hypothetical protein
MSTKAFNAFVVLRQSTSSKIKNPFTFNFLNDITASSKTLICP